jgi:hypothetical protein
VKFNCSIKSIRNIVGIWIMVTGSISTMCAQAADVTVCGTEAQEKQKEISLRATAMEVLRTIRLKDSEAFAGHIYKDGMGIGGDVAFTPLSEIKAQFRRRQGIYCLLFSTPCLASAKFPNDPADGVDLSKWKISYSEWLILNHPSKVEIEMIDTGGVEICGGDVYVRGRRKLKSAPDSLELGFTYMNGKWAVSHIPVFP